MILTLVGVVMAGVSGGMAIGRWLQRRRDLATAPLPLPSRVSEQHALLDGFPCQLGDVVMRLTGDEAWLAGGLVFSEDRPVAALFVAPNAGHDRVLYVRPKPHECVYWMALVDSEFASPLGEPPSALEHGSLRFDRVRRLPVRCKRMGAGAPDLGELGDTVIVAEYTSTGSARAVVIGHPASGRSHTYQGEALDPSAYEVIASGHATLPGPRAP